MSTRRATIELPEPTISEHDGVRYLHLGTPWVQGAMRLKTPRRIELEYVQRMMAWLLWKPLAPGDDAHAVQLGLGAGAITRFTHGPMRLRTTAVEINPGVVAACRHWFRLPDDGARLQVLQADALRWLADARHTATADVLCVDLYDHDAARPVLDDAESYIACRRVLAEGGVMTVNLFGRDARFDRSAGLIAAAFGAHQVWTLRPTREGNTIVVAAAGIEVPEANVLRERARYIEAAYGLPARKWLKLVRPWGGGGA